MLLGNQGVKYGLQLPAKPAAKQVRKPQAAISAFQEGSDDEDTIGQQIARQQAKISTDVKVLHCPVCFVAASLSTASSAPYLAITLAYVPSRALMPLCVATGCQPACKSPGGRPLNL